MEGKRVSVRGIEAGDGGGFRAAGGRGGRGDECRPRRAASLPTRKSRFDRPTPCFANDCTRRRSASCRTSRRLFPPRPEGLRNKGPQPTTHLTVNGRLSVRRTVYWSPQNGTVIPIDQWLGLAEHRFSPGVREMCCREALHCSFEVASDNLQRTAQLSLEWPHAAGDRGKPRACGAGGPAKRDRCGRPLRRRSARPRR